MIYELKDDRYITAFSAEMEPALTVEDGSDIVFYTKDCYMNNLRAENDPRGAAEGPAVGCNPATGPVYVRGAMPGDTLECVIREIAVGDYASMRISNRAGFMKGRVTSPIVRCVPLLGGTATVAGQTFPLDPMIGVIGVAPASGAVDTETPREHGGNMDTRLITAGSRLYLPVRQAGALLALGDVHARMGDGEMCVCGLECPARVTVTVNVIHEEMCPWPALRDRDGGLSVIASAETMEEAGHLAADAMLDLLKRRTGKDENELILLMSLICHMEISQVVDPLVTVRVRIEKGVI